MRHSAEFAPQNIILFRLMINCEETGGHATALLALTLCRRISHSEPGPLEVMTAGVNELVASEIASWPAALHVLVLV